jgi:hypothetical protein
MNHNQNKESKIERIAEEILYDRQMCKQLGINYNCPKKDDYQKADIAAEVIYYSEMESLSQLKLNNRRFIK